MSFSKIALTTTAAAAGFAKAAILAAMPALADPQVVAFGQSAEIPGAAGAGAIDYTVSDLQPSGHNDGVWYSTVTAQAVSGSPTPNIADLDARAVNSSTCAVLRNGTDGLPNGPIAAGTTISGGFTSTLKGAQRPTASFIGMPAAGTRPSGRRANHFVSPEPGR